MDNLKSMEIFYDMIDITIKGNYSFLINIPYSRVSHILCWISLVSIIFFQMTNKTSFIVFHLTNGTLVD